MIVTALILAIVAALVEHFFGIPEPWRKLVWFGIVALFVIGIVLVLLGTVGPLPRV